VRPRSTLRAQRATQLTIAAALLAVPVSGLALTAARASAPDRPSAGAAAPAATVTSRIDLPRRPRSVLSGTPIALAGRLLPAVAGRPVVLQGRSGSGWTALSHARTGRLGRVAISFVPPPAVRRGLRVVFAGDRSSGPVASPAGTLTVFSVSVASWYDDAGETACGFHAEYGVANRTLPCGTHVELRHGGRDVTAVVDDRGPFVGGRDWDLNQNTAAALGFGGVGELWTAVALPSGG